MPFKGVSYLDIWQPFCSAEPNHLCNFSRRYPMFVGNVALPPKSTAMVMVGQSVHLTTLFPGQA